jgi:hypothetical protein
MSGALPGSQQPQNLQQLIPTLQDGNVVLGRILSALTAGVAIQNRAPVLTVATLPVSGAAGQFIWASNGRKGGEGAGAGTGLFVYWNPATSSWFTMSGNILVTS